MILNFLAYAAVGRVAIFFLQRFPFAKISYISKFFADGTFLRGLLDCDLCLGVWVYTVLAFTMQIDVLEGWFAYIPILSELITGSITSLIVHLVRVGWQAEYTTTWISTE